MRFAGEMLAGAAMSEHGLLGSGTAVARAGALDGPKVQRMCVENATCAGDDCRATSGRRRLWDRR
jgi:hypothetical protein